MNKLLKYMTLLTGLFFLVPALTFADVSMISDQTLVNNLLDNPNFENGINSWDSAGPNWTTQAAVTHEGTIAVKNTISALVGQDYFASLSQTKSLSAGQNIYATVYAKSNIDVRSSAVAGLLVEFLKSDGTLISKKQDQIGGLTDWRQLYVTATAPANTAQVRLHVFVYAAQNDATSVDGVAYFDQAVLSTDFIAAPAAKTALINNGFENGLNDWTLLYSPSFSVEQGGANEGSYSARNVIQSIVGQDFFSSAYQDLQYLGGPVYASAYVKTNMNPASSAVAGFLLEFYNGGGTKLGSSQQTVVGTNNWTRLLINGVTPPVGTTTIRVHAFTFAVKNDSATIGATANFDNIVFSYQPLPVGNFRTTVLNSGFENGLNNWSEIYGFPSTISAVPYTGSYSAKKTIGQIEGKDYYSQIYQDVYYNTNGDPFPTGMPVYAVAYAKTSMNPVTKSKAGLQLEFIDSLGDVIKDINNNPIVSNDSVGGQNDWRYLYVTKTTPPTTAKVRVSGFEFAREADSALAGDGYYDDFQFSLSPLAVPVELTNLRNANFENGLNDWQELYSPGEVSTNPIHLGNYAARFQVDNTVLTKDYYGAASQDIKTKAGDTISAKLWVKTDISPLAPGTVAGLSVIFLNTSGQQVGSEISSHTGGQQDWVQLFVNASAPTGAVKVRFSAFLFAPKANGAQALGAKAYFDDASLGIAGYYNPCSSKIYRLKHPNECSVLAVTDPVSSAY